MIINRNYENLFDHSPWNNYVHQCLYLIACSLSDLKKGDLKPAQTTMSIINLEKWKERPILSIPPCFTISHNITLRSLPKTDPTN